MSNIFTGANLIYDRHNVYIKMNDVQLTSNANKILFRDKTFKCADCNMDLSVFNRDLLLVGNVPSIDLRNEATHRLMKLSEKRRIFNQLKVKSKDSNFLLDSWITLSIRTYIVSNSSIDPHVFKIITWGGVVYLMGDVMPDQAELVVNYAKNCYGVVKVIKLFKYYNLSD